MKKFKLKIVFVAVTSLCLGILSGLPAQAAKTHDSNTDLSISSSEENIFLNVTDSSTTLGLTPAAITYSAGATYDSITVSISITVPSGSARTAADVTLNQTSAQASSSKFTLNSRTSNTYTFLQNATTTAVAITNLATIGFTPDVLGKYVLTFTDGAAHSVSRTLNVVKTDQNLHSLTFAAGGTSATATITTVETATASVKVSFVAAAAMDSVTVKANIIDGPSGGLSQTLQIARTDSTTSSGVTFGSASSTYATASTGMTFGALTSGATAVGTFAVALVKPTVAGTYTIRVTDAPMANGAVSNWGTAITPLTFTVTVTAAATTASGNSYSVLRPYGNTIAQGTAKTDSTVVASRSAASTVTTPQATIFVVEDNATSTASESLTVSVSGPATIGSDAASRPSATAATFAYTGVSGGEPVYVWANGTAGAATITVKTISGLTIGTHTVYFNGPRTAIKNDADPVPLTNLRAGGKSLDAWDVSITDAAGMPIIGVTSALSCVIADTLVVASCSFADNGDGTYLMTLNSASGSKSGASTTVTARMTDPAVTTSTAYISAAAVKVTLAGTANKYTITTDKSSYTPGEQMIVTVSAVDASGNPVHDNASVPTVLSNKSVTGLANIGTKFAAGKADSIARKTDGTVTQQYRVFAPASGGSFDLYFDYTDAALAAQRATVTATVADAAMDAATDAANEATDAANAATDAALAAADAADAATAAAQDASDAVAALSAEVSKMIASLKAQITSLNKLLVKIQKKVRA